MSGPETAVFGSYNARSTSPELVAAGFVAPPQFWSILPPGNTVLSGPRGSGKTTLLKMLTAPGLEAWQDPQAEEACRLARYSGVFVPADRSWAGQIEAVGRQFDDDLRVALGSASFVLHALRALVQCARQRVEPPNRERCHERVEIDSSVQQEIARAVYAGWGLGAPVGSFLGLQIALRDEISALGRLAKGAARSSQEDRLREHPALNLELIDVVLPFIERFNQAAGKEDHIWAFLIDEIEFLPQGIQAMLVNSVRGRDPRIIQKVSIAPYTTTSTEQLNTPLGGWVGHDLQVVDLTFTEKEQGYRFSRELAQKEIGGANLSPRSRRPPEVRQILGGSGFFERHPGTDAYLPGSDNAKAINRLAVGDESFTAWLKSKRIDPEHLEDVRGKRRSETVQKAISIILLRDEYLHEVRGTMRGRSRKRHVVYVGEETIFAICENNPRLLKALLGKLLALQRAGTLRPGACADAVQECCEEYRLHLRAIEVERSLEDALMPRRLIETIGTAFATDIYGPKFDPEPPLSFSVSDRDRARFGMRSVLAQLTHYGAIVPEEKDSYRLAHMFAPLYHLPLRKGRSRALSGILEPPKEAPVLPVRPSRQKRGPGQLEIEEPS